MALIPPELMPLVFRTTIPKTPEFVEMIDNMSKVEPIERDKFWSLLSTVASLDWLGASPILRETLLWGVPEVITVEQRTIDVYTSDRWKRRAVITIDRD